MGSLTREPTLKTVVIFYHTDAGFNTPLGHCRKTEAILEYFGKHHQQNNWRWLVSVLSWRTRLHMLPFDIFGLD